MSISVGLLGRNSFSAMLAGHRGVSHFALSYVMPRPFSRVRALSSRHTLSACPGGDIPVGMYPAQLYHHADSGALVPEPGQAF